MRKLANLQQMIGKIIEECSPFLCLGDPVVDDLFVIVSIPEWMNKKEKYRNNNLLKMRGNNIIIKNAVPLWSSVNWVKELNRLTQQSPANGEALVQNEECLLKHPIQVV